MGSPHQARLNQIEGSWIPQTADLGQWIQVDLGNISMVTKIATQGSHEEADWVTEYMVSYSFDGGNFHFYRPASNTSFDKVIFEQ